MKEYGIGVDVRHLNLLADSMCNTGKVLGITRYGISKVKNSTLMQASFEKTMEVLFDAATSNKVDTLNGVSERIILVNC